MDIRPLLEARCPYVLQYFELIQGRPRLSNNIDHLQRIASRAELMVLAAVFARYGESQISREIWEPDLAALGPCGDRETAALVFEILTAPAGG